MLAASLGRETLADGAVPYQLYERFRPTVPPGHAGWGAKGELDLGLVLDLKDDVRRTLQAMEAKEERERESEQHGAAGAMVGGGGTGHGAPAAAAADGFVRGADSDG
eukprot:SAG22_NODE_4102_length_1386_cov_0.930847_2_plen_107_part_00